MSSIVWPGRLWHEVAKEKHQVGRALRETPHEVRKPVRAKWNVHPQAKGLADESLLQISADSIEHLKLELLAANILLAREFFRRPDHRRIMCRDAVINSARQKQ